MKNQIPPTMEAEIRRAARIIAELDMPWMDPAALNIDGISRRVRAWIANRDNHDRFAALVMEYRIGG